MLRSVVHSSSALVAVNGKGIAVTEHAPHSNLQRKKKVSYQLILKISTRSSLTEEVMLSMVINTSEAFKQALI